MKRKVIEVKPRSEIILSAQSKLQGGPMKHRLEPKGGAKKEDFLEEYELSKLLDNNVNAHIRKVIDIFNETFNQFDDYKISQEFDEGVVIVNVEKKNVKNFYLGVDIVYQQKEKQKFTIKMDSFDDQSCLKELSVKTSSSPTGEFSHKEGALLLYKLIEQQVEVSNKLISIYEEINVDQNHSP